MSTAATTVITGGSSGLGLVTARHLATASPAPRPNGGYFSEARPDTPSRRAMDDALARTVYEKTARLLGVEPL